MGVIHVSIERCKPADMPACFEVISDTFKHDEPIVDALFPDHEKASGRKQAAERLTKQLETDKDAFFLKAVQTGKGFEKIVGFALWTHMITPTSLDLSTLEDMAAVWPDRNEGEFASRLYAKCVRPRNEAIEQAEKGKGALVLEILAVHPDAQSRKVGTKLVQWGTSLADEKGIEAIVEAMLIAVECYEKNGFKTTIPRMRFEVGEEFKLRKTPESSFMRRPATIKV